jgi:Fur family ferric uptake transcriptional regulator
MPDNQGPHILPSLPKVAPSGGMARLHQKHARQERQQQQAPGAGDPGAAHQPPPQQSLAYEPVCAIFRRYLHGEKLKFTPERAMMLDAVMRKEGLFEPEALISDLKQLGHRVSRATVYRTLSHLQDAGIVKQVFFDNKRSYYEVIAGRQTYDYLICVATGRVIEFVSDKLRKLRDEICREHGFDPLSHQFHVFGLSPEGKALTKETPGGSRAAVRPSGEVGTSQPAGSVLVPGQTRPTAPSSTVALSRARRTWRTSGPQA